MNLDRIKNPWKRRFLLILVMPYVLCGHFYFAMRYTFWRGLKDDVGVTWKGSPYVQ